MISDTTSPTSATATAKSDSLQEAPMPDRIDPGKIRVVDVEHKDTGEIMRRDCYDPDGGVAEMGDVMQLKNGELWLRTVDWARSESFGAEMSLTWEPTGLSPDEVGRVGVFTWPLGEAVEIYADQK